MSESKNLAPSQHVEGLMISAAEARALLHGMPDYDFSAALTRISTWLAEYDETPMLEPLSPAQTHADALADLEDVRKAVFGDVGDEPNVYADYDKCSELSGKMRRALAALASPSPQTRATSPSTPDRKR